MTAIRLYPLIRKPDFSQNFIAALGVKGFELCPGEAADGFPSHAKFSGMVFRTCFKGYAYVHHALLYVNPES